MTYTADIRLCDDAGMVSDDRVEPGSPGTILDPDLTYRRLVNNLRGHTGLPAYTGPAFHCTGSAHLAREHFRCTNPIHAQTASPVYLATVVEHHCRGCRCQPTIRLGGDAMPPWGYRIVGIGA